MNKNLLLIFTIVLFVLFLAACGASNVEGPSSSFEGQAMVQEADGREVLIFSILDQLDELKTELNISSLYQIKGFSGHCEDTVPCIIKTAEQGFLAENLYELSNAQGLFFNFSLNEPVQQNQNPLQFILLDSSTSFLLEKSGITVSVNNLPVAQFAFSDPVIWESGEVYSLFFSIDLDGGLNVSMWKKGAPESLVSASTIAEDGKSGFPEEPKQLDLQLNLWVSQNQQIKITNIWALGLGETFPQVSTSAESEGQASSDENSESLVLTNLEEYAVLSSDPVQQLNCEGVKILSAGEFRWEGMSDSNCDLKLKNGEALVFDFVLDNDMEPDQTQVVWMLNTQDEEGSTYGIGIAAAENVVKVLKNHNQVLSFDFDSGLVWKQGKSYTAAILLETDGGKLVKIWETENPENRIFSYITAEEWLSAISADINSSDWNFGVWMMQSQSVTLQNMQFLHIDQSSADRIEPAAQETGQTLDDTSLANLSGYIVNAVHPVSNLECGSAFQEIGDSWQLSGEEDGFTGQCDLKIQKGQALMLDFSFGRDVVNAKNRVTLGLASNTDPADGGQGLLEIEASPANDDFGLKYNYQFITANQFQNNISWEVDEEYRLVLAVEDDGSIQAVIWPLNDSGIPVNSRFEAQDLQNIAVDLNLSEISWLFSYYIDSGQSITLKNIRTLELEGSYSSPQSVLSQGADAQDLSDQVFDLNDFYLASVLPVESFACDDGQIADGNIYRILADGDALRGKCDIMFGTGQALVFDFSFGAEMGEDENRLFLEFHSQATEFLGRTSLDLYHQMLQIKKDEVGLGAFPFSKDLSLEPGKIYTLFVFAGEGGYKHFILYEQGKLLEEIIADPESAGFAAITQADWFEMFETSFSEQNLEMYYDISVGQSLTISNVKILTFE